jgi:hypothetical protein
MRSAVGVVLLTLALVGCGGGDAAGEADGEAKPAAVETVVARGVDLTLEPTRSMDSISGTVVIANRSGREVVVSDPERTDIGAISPDHLRLVAMRGEDDPDFSDALTPVAPPTFPGVAVAAERTLEVDVHFSGYGPDRRTMELCLEVIEVVGRGSPDRHGEEVTVAGREPGAPAPMACSGPVEIAEESFDDEPADEG